MAYTRMKRNSSAQKKSAYRKLNGGLWQAVLQRLKTVIRFFKRTWRLFKHLESAEVAPKTQPKSKYFMSRTKPRSFFLGILFTSINYFLIGVLILGFSGLGMLIGISKSYLDSIPNLDITQISQQDKTTFIYDADGKELMPYYGVENRVWAHLDEIPKNLQNAVIAIEDVRFKQHQGVDFRRLFSSILKNFSSNSIQGGSTLTQQVIKNTVLTQEQTYKRKLQEIYLALQLEKEYSKDEILEAYINTIYMGGSNYGLKAASIDYLGKEDLNSLSLRECAMLAGMIQNPGTYHPRLNYYVRPQPTDGKPNSTDKRTNLVLMEMLQNGFIDKAQYDAAMADKLSVEREAPQNSNNMPYYMDYLMQQVVIRMLEKYELENNSENRAKMDLKLRTGGYKIYATVKPSVQKSVEETLYSWVNYPSLASSSDKYVSEKGPDGSTIKIIQPQAAAVVIDPATGQIRAMVGGRQAPQYKREFNRAWQSIMPVGSAIKPLSVYAPALDLGASPSSLIYDVDYAIPGWTDLEGKPDYPQNYSKEHSGIATMRTSVQKSLNTGAAQTLLRDVTVPVAEEYLLNLNINSKHINADPPGLALGTSGITPLEMAAGYAALANKGLYMEPIAFTKIVDNENKVIIDMTQLQLKRQVYSAGAAWMMVDMLHGAVSSNLVSGITAGGKTGTNSDARGVSFCGITGYYAASVWVGHDRYKPLAAGTVGSNGAMPIFTGFMNKIHQGLSNKPIIADSPESLGLVKVKFCKLTGEPASPACPHTNEDWILADKLAAQPTCRIHRQAEFCKTSGKLATQYCPEEDRELRSFTSSGSYVYNFPKEILAKYGITLPQPTSFPDDKYLAGLIPGSPEYNNYYCTLHSEQTQIDQQHRQEIIARGRNLIVDAHSFLIVHADTLTQPQQAELTALINALDTAINDGFPTSNIEAALQALEAKLEDFGG